MSYRISYMGTKHQLAPYVRDLVAICPNGPFLDLFSGMCAVSQEIGEERPIWCNDAQLFSCAVAKSLFTSRDIPLGVSEAVSNVAPYFEKNKDSLLRRYKSYINQEECLLKRGAYTKIKKFCEEFPVVGTNEKIDRERKRLSSKKNTFPYRLFSITYACGYFGLYQSVEIDSIRYALEKALLKKLITSSEYRWLLLALCQAISRSSTTTGHFAQFLKINSNNKRRYIEQRTRSIWVEWMRAIEGAKVIGTTEWRKKNKVFNSDAIKLVKKMAGCEYVPSVIYADPPYTEDQYSRYYHIYETLIRYDYPESIGKGRYRPDRFRSDFSLTSKANQALEDLISCSSKLGCSLIISYPEDSLIKDSRASVLRTLKKYFGKAEIAYCLPHIHSSMGASKGVAKHSVNEILFMAY